MTLLSVQSKKCIERGREEDVKCSAEENGLTVEQKKAFI